MNKYIKRMLSLVLVLVFIMVQINLNVNVKKVRADGNSSITKLKILEIEPGDQYVLKQSMFPSNVDITQMPMSEFIGKIDKVNGMYDIVYIGNKVYKKDVPTYSGNSVSGKNEYTIKYSKVGKEAPKTGVDFGESDQDDSNHVEYYSENDITNKKAQELIEFIKSGQLFLFDKSILQDEELDGSKLLNNLKKYQNMSNFKAVDSNLTSDSIMNYYNNSSKRPVVTIKSSPLPYNGDLQTYNPDRNMNFVFDIDGNNSHTFTTKLYCDMNGDGLFKDYESYASIDKQKGGTNLQLSYTVPDYFAGLMPWKLEVTDDSTNVKSYQYGYTLYKSDNVAPIRVLQIYPANNLLDLTQDLTKVKLQQQGYYNIQITKKSCDEFNKYNDIEYPSTYKKALDAFNAALDDLYAELENNYKNYDKWAWFTEYDEVLSDVRGSFSKIENLKIINDKEYQSTYKKAFDDFDTALNNFYTSLDNHNKIDHPKKGIGWESENEIKEAEEELEKVVNSRISLNGNYDMVIIGFADMYGGSSFTENATDSIIDFMKTGQSLMLTHDTISTYLTDDRSNMYGYQFNKKLRDYIGQSRYVDENNPNETDYDGSEIPHDSYPDANGIPSYGFTTDMIMSHNNYNNEKPQSWGSHYYFDHNQATKVNDGVFSEYPYILGRNNYDPNTLNISQTHHQYFQLNLEDEDVVPWYDLSGVINTGGSAGNVNDPRNYYYTYSKGNITYSGTGHSSPKGSQDEQEMFLNTIVKAARTANHAPTVNVFNLNDGQYVSKNQSSLDFSFTAQDPDQNDEKQDALRRKIYINDTPIDENGKSVSDYKTMTSGDTINVSIPKDKLSELAGSSSEVTVRIEVLDTQNAKGEKTITFKYVDEPSLSASVSGLKNGYLVGDTAQTQLKIDAANSTSSVVDTMFLSNKNSGSISGDGLSVNCINELNGSNTDMMQSSETDLQDINFIPQVDNQNTTKNFTFKFNNEGSYKVQNLFKYNFLKLDNKVQRSWEYDYSLKVKEGDIYIKCVDSSGRVFTSPVGIKVTRPDGTFESKNTDSTGGTEFLKEPSDSYSISVQNNTGYTLTDPSTQSVSLSYDNPNQTIILHFQTLVSPSIEVNPSCNSNGWNNTDVKVTLVKPVNFVDKLQKMQYKIDNGDWTDYTDLLMIQNDGQHKVMSRTVDDSSGVGSTATEKAINIDQTKPPKPDIVNNDGDVCINSANISIKFKDDEANGSGIDKMEYSFDEVNWTESNSANKDIEVTSNCTVYARELDKAGNYSDTSSLQVNIINADSSDFELEGLTFNTIPEGGHVNFNVKVRIGVNEDGTPKYAVPSNNITVTVQSKDISIIDMGKNHDNLDDAKNDGVVDQTDNSKSISGVVTGDGGDTITAFGMIGAANKQTDIVVTLEKKDGNAISLTKTVKVVGSESGLLY